VNLVVDTNIVFSTLLNPHTAIGEILMNVQGEMVFFAPDLLREGLERYSLKIKTYSKLDKPTLLLVEELVLSNIIFIPEESINQSSWDQANELTKDIDEDDTPFIALCIELNAKLWTGDKVLAQGLLKKGKNLTVTTADLQQLKKQ
jgi:predicted nucleic acid-binding protein